MKKIDFKAIGNKAKDFLLEKGERVGLAVCGVIAILLMGIGIMKGMTPTKPKSGLSWDKELQTNVERLEAALKVGGTEPMPEVKVDDTMFGPFAWLFRDSKFQGSQFFPYPEAKSNKRDNPKIFTVIDGLYQVDYLRGGVVAYAIEQSKQNAWVLADAAEAPKGQDGGAVTAPVKEMQPRRMMVASMVFPWRHQLVEYLRALKMNDLTELQAQDAFPRPLGLNVWRFEVKDGAALPNTKVQLYFHDKDKKAPAAAPHIQEFLNAADIDTDNLARLGYYIVPGLVTPLPRLANIKYPKVELSDLIKEDTTVVAGMGKDNKPGIRDPLPKQGGLVGVPLGKKPEPMGNPQANQAIPEKIVKWSTLPKDLVAKFKGRFSVFDPAAALLDATGADPKKGVGMPVFQPKEGGFRKPPMGKEGADPGNEPAGQELHDMLARFIDVDLEPGKTYAYFVQVRMANPNLGKKKEVAYLKLAEEEELVSVVTQKPIVVTVPPEYFLYTTDQRPDNPLVVNGSDGPLSPLAKRSDVAPIQIQKWVGKVGGADRPFSIADWVIAERLLIPRGEYLGRNDVNIETPVWNRGLETFEVGVDGDAFKQKDPKRKIGVKMGFMPNPAPILVDFDGGQKKSVKVGTVSITDESAYELLILGPDRKLTVRNSRVDSDDPIRISRYESWREKIRPLRQQANAPAKKDGGASGN